MFHFVTVYENARRKVLKWMKHSRASRSHREEKFYYATANFEPFDVLRSSAGDG